MDEVDAVPRSRRQRPKDSFQNELQSKLKQRKNLGLSADMSDTDEDGLGPEISDYNSLRAGRPGSAKKRTDPSSSLRGGLGTTTMGARDLTQLLGHSRNRYDDEDEEIMAANYGRSSGGRTWQTSPTQDSRRSNRTPTIGSPKDQTGKLDSIFGRKTPTRDTQSTSKSPQSGLSKEDIIFGRKTPSSDGKRSPADGSRRLPGMDGTSDKWQPPNFRSVSPSSSVEHSRGSRGVTPVDSALGTISETPREKVTPRIQRGQGLAASPRQPLYGQAPKPQARNLKSDSKTPPLLTDSTRSPIAGERKTPPIVGDRKTPPIAGDRRTPPITDPRKKSPLFKGEPDSQMKRTTPTLDLFGKSRTATAQDLGSYILNEEDGTSKNLKSDKHLGYSRSKTSGSGKDAVSTRGKAGSTSPGFRQGQERLRSPVGRKTPTQAKDTQSSLERKTPEDPRRGSLLDFLMDDSTAGKPKPKERGRESEGRMKSRAPADGSVPGRTPTLRSKSPGPQRDRKSPDILAQPEEMFKTAPSKQQPEDTSSICEDIPSDPNRKLALAQQEGPKSTKQTTERAKADSAIDTIAEAQTMEYIEPAKKMRPFTANAKVQHRPKPRYGTLPGSTQPLQERQFNSTGDIRDAIYEEWYSERLKSARKKKREEEKKKQGEEEEKKKAEQEKRLEAEASYRAWMSKKKEVLLTEKEEKERREMKKLDKEKQEAEEKRIESVKSFHHWKQKKDAMIKRELHRKSEEKAQAEEEKRDEERRKQKERETAFNGWKAKKEKSLHNTIAEKRYLEKTQRQRAEEEKEELRRKEEEAMDRYNKWLDDKERQKKQEKRQAKQRRLMGEDEFKPAFRPASRTIPFGH